MTDVFSKAHRSEIMARIGQKNTTPELIVRRLLHKMGLRFRLHGVKLPGKPDVVLPRWKAVVFVHGCFWHGHTCKRGGRPEQNKLFWAAKLEGNMRRDRVNQRALKALGWRVITIWQCELRFLTKVSAKLTRILRPNG